MLRGLPNGRLLGGTGSFGNVAMNHFQRVFRCEGLFPGEQFVERHAQGVKIGTIIHGAVHPAGLFRRHGGKRAFQDVRRMGNGGRVRPSAARCQNR